MLDLLALFAGAFTLAITGALMPGPLLTITIADSAKRGFKTGPLLITGHAILELALIVAVIFGLGAFLKIPLVKGIIAFLGGAILLWMGIGMIRSASKLKLDLKAGGNKIMSSQIIAGILFSASNPYWILWWATVGMGYLIVARKLGTIGVVVFFFGHISADFLWYSLISYGVSRGRKLFTEKTYQTIIKVCGVVLLFFGGWFFFSGGKFLLPKVF